MSLRMENVHVTLAGTPVLRDVSLTVEPGELLALVGPNGAGKTTVLNVLAGDLAPDSGTVELDGRPVSALRVGDLARRRAVLPQEQRLAFGFRSIDVVRMGRAPWAGRPEDEHDDRVVHDAMQRTDVVGLAARTFPTLSGGEKARTSLARVVAQSTPVVLLDEPTAALDIRHAEHVLGEAVALTEAGHAVVAVLHDLSVAATHAHRVCLLAGGRIRALGRPADVIRPDLVEEVYGHPVDVLEHGDRLVVVPRRLTAPRSQEAPCVHAP
ncbi:ABC transporter, ATP-binding protein [Aeromicrobium marinum DSM 15272]|uniref:ABC transporter, ATP-binding protein n=1 Tax=Aeromicrobium marinum DSM 15272 TaxID=585531 RepID=E2SBN9_9ACTN|nr:heme ABC transporter ATP-binding protein [Aeromicrobium marinum]EFQ83785.1 ABC transporter, ATP-binding protein [Aeromicrobium marinum DSM 15272]